MLTMGTSASLHPHSAAVQRGVTLIEILVTIVILAFGLIGLVGMQTKVQASQAESYQRAQAVLLVQDMANRLSANRVNAAAYVTATPLGTGDSQPASCSTLTGAAKDLCEWSHEIQGSSEQQASTNVGAMVNARGCVDQVGTNPSVYRVTLVWQSLSDLTAPSLPCGQGKYPRETLRRAIASFVTVANLTL